MGSRFVLVLLGLVFSLVSAQFGPECAIPALRNPQDFVATAQSDATVSVDWRRDPEDGGGDNCLKHYLVEAQVTYNDWCGDVVYYNFIQVITNQPNAELDLEIPKPYNDTLTTIAAYTIYEDKQYEYEDTSVASEATIDTARGAAPSQPPMEVAINTKEEALTFEWDKPPCGSRHGFIRGYSYRLNTTEGELLESGNTDVRVVHFQNFENGDYLFEVAAKTDNGVGPYSEPLHATYEQQDEWDPAVAKDIKKVIAHQTKGINLLKKAYELLKL